MRRNRASTPQSAPPRNRPHESTPSQESAPSQEAAPREADARIRADPATGSHPGIRPDPEPSPVARIGARARNPRPGRLGRILSCADRRRSPAARIATWEALGTSVVLRVTDPGALARRAREVERELDAIDRACSRFRADSELSRVNARAGAPVRVSSAADRSARGGPARRRADRRRRRPDGRPGARARRLRPRLAAARRAAGERARAPPTITARVRAGWRTVALDRSDWLDPHPERGPARPRRDRQSLGRRSRGRGRARRRAAAACS